MLLGTVALLFAIAMLPLGSTVLLAWVMVALLMLRRRRIRRGATVRILTLAVMALLRRAVPLMGLLLTIGVVRWRSVLALYACQTLPSIHS